MNDNSSMHPRVGRGQARNIGPSKRFGDRAYQNAQAAAIILADPAKYGGGQPLRKIMLNVKEWSGSSHSQVNAWDNIVLSLPFRFAVATSSLGFSSGIAKPHFTPT